jgi:hypothetical protein
MVFASGVACLLESNPDFHPIADAGSGEGGASTLGTSTNASTDFGTSTTDATMTSSTVTSSTVTSSTTLGTTSTEETDADGTGSEGSAYAAAILADGPVAYWRLEEQVPPTAVDLGPNQFNGTYQGSIEYEVSGALCGEPSSRGKRFLGGDSVIDMGEVLGFQGSVPYTLEFWAKFEAIEGGDVASSGGLVGNNEYSSGDWFGYHMTVHNTAENESLVRLNRPPSGSANATAPPPGQWTHIVGVWDGATTNTVYINGELAASRVASSEPVTGILPHLGRFRVGDVDGWGEVQATLDEVAVYDYVLPVSRINEHYQLGAGC